MNASSARPETAAAPPTARCAVAIAISILLLSHGAGGAEPGQEGCGALLTRIGRESGVDFRHDPGGKGDKHYPETMGSGAAWLDYDGDGWLDLYAVQSGPFPPDGSAAAENRLFRNRGHGAFEDVTQRSGTGHRGYGQGVLAADLDGDGNVDLHVSNYGLDAYLRNRGNGSFDERSREAGLALDGWSIVGAAADADGDGDLDLAVTRYLVYDLEITCVDRETGNAVYCGPELFLGEGDRFFLNRGAGIFTDATSEAGLAGADGKGMGIALVDLDGDRAPEIYISNDLTLNLLYRNLGGARFEDISLMAGTAVNAEGELESGMGIAVGDVDSDGDPDLAVTGWDVETNTLYRNMGGLLFEDISAESGFGLPSFNYVGFGPAFLDIDLDGDLDFYASNGHVREQIRRDIVTRAEPDLLLLGDGAGRFETARCAWLTREPKVSRGFAVGDYDNDGDPDLAIQHSGDTLDLLRNDGSHGDWLGVHLIGRPPNSEEIGAQVTLIGREKPQVRWIQAGHGYASSSDKRLLFALGAGGDQVLEVVRRDGSVQRFHSPPSGRYLHLMPPLGSGWRSPRRRPVAGSR